MLRAAGLIFLATAAAADQRQVARPENGKPKDGEIGELDHKFRCTEAHNPKALIDSFAYRPPRYSQVQELKDSLSKAEHEHTAAVLHKQNDLDGDGQHSLKEFWNLVGDILV